MKYVIPVLMAALTLLASSGSIAGEISVYRDKDGVLNLTDRPAPSGVRVEHVIRYKEKKAAELNQRQQPVEQKRLENEKIQHLRDKTARARKEAETESGRAREKSGLPSSILKTIKPCQTASDGAIENRPGTSPPPRNRHRPGPMRPSPGQITPPNISRKQPTPGLTIKNKDISQVFNVCTR